MHMHIHMHMHTQAHAYAHAYACAHRTCLAILSGCNFRFDSKFDRFIIIADPTTVMTNLTRQFGRTLVNVKFVQKNTKMQAFRLRGRHFGY